MKTARNAVPIFQKSLQIVVALFGVLHVTLAAQGQNSLPVVSIPTTNVVEQKKFTTTSVELSYESKLIDREYSEYESNLILLAIPTFELSEKSKLSVRLQLNQKLYNDKKTEFENTTFNLDATKAPLEISGQELLFTPSIFLIAPTNETERERKTFRGGVGAAVKFGTQFNEASLPISASYTLSALKNNHEFERAYDYSPNLSHRIRHIVVLDLSLTERLSASVLARYQTGWTYQDAFRSTYFIQEELGYKLQKDYSVFIAHSNLANALEANGIDSNIRLYNKRSSFLSVGIRGQF